MIPVELRYEIWRLSLQPRIVEVNYDVHWQKEDFEDAPHRGRAHRTYANHAGHSLLLPCHASYRFSHLP
ncbi:hypothetical protein BDZ45DRAFT_10552 [Acephala macrosclerotiorum]|nr:hypothetical protein BDZ45DRAFT_10552 [Acephala macrosclerotiorum]